MTGNTTNATEANGTRIDTDVAIVGAGPAGCVLAHLLARSGIETILLERRHDLSRDFRGYGFQPPVLRLFEELGVLDDVLDLPHRKLRRGDIIAYDARFTMFDWRSDADSFDYAIQMNQGPLLTLLLEWVEQSDCATYLDGTTVTSLSRRDGAVDGVEATRRPNGEKVDVRSRLVVGADGRFSTVREAAGIDDGRQGSDLELLWFKLGSSPADIETHLRIADAGVLVYAPLNDTEGQYGLFIESGSYPELRDRGIDHLRERVGNIEPDLKRAVRDDLDSFDDCALLDIESGLAPEWRRDGLLLVGDAAHVASPFGEGNVLAMHDAVRAHPEIAEALRQSEEIVSAESLADYELARRKSVQASMESSAHLQQLMSFVTGDSALPRPIRRTIIRNLFRVMRVATSVGERVPHGVDDSQYVPVRSGLLSE